MTDEKYKSQFIEQTRRNFLYFFSHELIAKDPMTLSEEEIWTGIKARSGCRPVHSCGLIARMNRYCTVLVVKGHRSFPNPYNGGKICNGIFSYKYGDGDLLETPYSCFKYLHVFNDFGFVHSSFGESRPTISNIITLVENGQRKRGSIMPEDLFERNIGTELFLEYSIDGKSYYDWTTSKVPISNGIRAVPYLLYVSEGTDYITEVRKSLLRTKFFLLALVNKYPRHLMPVFQKDEGQIEAFDKLVETELRPHIDQLYQTTLSDMNRFGLNTTLPF